MSLLRVRHAKVAAEGICYGQLDVATVMPASNAAAVVLAQLSTRGEHVERVVCSPWSRTRDLAIVLAAALGVPWVEDARISELSFGEWEGRRWDELERTDASRFAEWMSNYVQVAPPGGETLAQLSERVHAFANEARGKPWLMVTHAGPIRVMRAVERGVAYGAVALEPVEHLAIEPRAAESRTA